MNVVSQIASDDQYHYGFNGKYKDNEFAGVGNNIDYGFRKQDTRTGRFLSVDPLTKQYPWYTPYQFAGNKPIAHVDLDGCEEFYAASGSLIGKYGTSTEIRVVYTGKNETFAKKMFSSGTSPSVRNFNKLYKSGSAGVETGTGALDKVAENWGNRFNGPSIQGNTEMSSEIFIVKINGTRYATYTKPQTGSTASAKKHLKIGGNFVATIHSHAAYDVTQQHDDNLFSVGTSGQLDGDKNISNTLGVPGYISTPNGSLRVYLPNPIPTDKIVLPPGTLPSDPKDPQTPPNSPPPSQQGNK
jgi:RHS repeat-associated protein